MRYARSQPFAIVDADGEYTPEFEAQFAAYVAGLEADVNHPEYGVDYREMLAMDREDLRALYAVTTDLMNAGPPPVTVLFTAVFMTVSLAMAAVIAWYVL